MATAVLAGRLLLAAVFALAGVAKLRDRAGTRATMRAFGVPERLAGHAALALPLAELGVAVAVVAASSAAWGAAAALALLLVFTGGVVNALRHGRTPDCGCFGVGRARPIGERTLVRNAALGAIALFVLLEGPGPAVGDWIGDRTTAELLLLAGGVLASAGVAFALERRRRARPAARAAAAEAEWVHSRSGLEVGVPAPDFTLPGACDGPLSRASLSTRGAPAVLVFTGTGCGACRELYPHLGRWQRALSGRLSIAVVSAADAGESRSLCHDHGIADVLVDDRPEKLLTSYRMPGTPSAVVLAPDGTIASRPVRGNDAIEELVRVTLAAA